MMGHYGLSLREQYWFVSENENVLWEDINYFDNSYDSYFYSATKEINKTIIGSMKRP